MTTHQRLSRPESDATDFWIDEAIWGHRLYDEQTPWLCFLEFLLVLQSEIAEGRAFVEAQPNSLKYKPYKRLYLRNILFNNPRISAILTDFTDDDTRWREWIAAISRNAAGLATSDFSYLRSQFDSFSDFAAVVEFLRSTSIEGDSNKRWSSKFVFPYGPASLYEDLNVKDSGAASNDRRFFARTGELLYLMLSRSGRGAELLTHLKRILFHADSKWDRLVAALQPGDERSEGERAGAYLPYDSLPEYSALADDWLRILRSSMPGYDCVPHLINLTGIHMVRYVLNRASEVVKAERTPEFLLEIIAPRRTVIRDLSAQSFTDNNSLSRQAVRDFIERIPRTSEWKQAVSSNDPVGSCSSLLRREVAWPDEDEDLSGIGSPAALLELLTERAVSRHRQHLDKFHSTWGREIGLSSRRGSRRIRYAPTDALLKTLVYCNVDGRIEFNEFLNVLFERYGFVIGDKQGLRIIEAGHCDHEVLSENARRLELRLSSMGLLRRLSDACAYVQNPFGKDDAK